MKRLALILTTLTLAVTPVAVGAPDPVPNPEHTFVLTRQLPNGTERTLDTFVEDGTFTNEQLIRSIAASAATQQRINNPAWVLYLYGPTNGGPHTDDDRIWSTLTA